MDFIDYELQNEKILETLDIQRGIDRLVERCYNNSNAAGWWKNNDDEIKVRLEKLIEISDNDNNTILKELVENLLIEVEAARVSQKIALIHSEISEALEADRKDLMDDKLPHFKGIVVEFGDAIIRICDLVGRMQSKVSDPVERAKLNLSNAIVEKIGFNEVREDHKLENREKEGGKKY